ncbi:murein biosynthesis integral membrane protein MurJ [soil metagenome]
MNTLLTKTKKFIFAQQTSIISSTMILSGMIFLSGIAGFIRYRILVAYFTTENLDIYFSAFRIPDLVFEIMINGALSTTFIPFYIEYKKKSKEQGNIISSIINVVSLSLFGFIIILLLFLRPLITIITPGFDGVKIDQIVNYSRLLLLGQLPFLVLGNFLTGISQARRAFWLPAIAPIVYNIAVITFTLLFAPTLNLYAPIIGVIVGAMLFFVIQLPVIFLEQFKYALVIGHLKESWRFFRTAAPRILTIIVAQIEATVDLSLATFLGSGAYTVFYFAQHLQLLPISIIGIAYGQASLPYLTDMYQDKKYTEFKKVIVDSLLNIFFLTIPAATFFIVARTAIVRLFFGGNKFDWDATVLTAITLSYFALSMPLHSIYYFLTRCFYAIFDTRTPFYISVAAILTNAGLSALFTLYFKLPVWSLALAFSIAMSLNVLFLIGFLYKKLGGFDMALLLKELAKILITAFNTSILTYFLMRLLDGLIFETNRTLNVFLLISLGFVFYSLMYIFLSWLFGVREMYIITSMILKAREYQRKILVVYKGVE